MPSADVQEKRTEVPSSAAAEASKERAEGMPPADVLERRTEVPSSTADSTQNSVPNEPIEIEVNQFSYLHSILLFCHLFIIFS